MKLKNPQKHTNRNAPKPGNKTHKKNLKNNTCIYVSVCSHLPHATISNPPLFSLYIPRFPFSTLYPLFLPPPHSPFFSLPPHPTLGGIRFKAVGGFGEEIQCRIYETLRNDPPLGSGNSFTSRIVGTKNAVKWPIPTSPLICKNNIIYNFTYRWIEFGFPLFSFWSGNFELLKSEII